MQNTANDLNITEETISISEKWQIDMKDVVSIVGMILLFAAIICLEVEYWSMRK